MLLFKIIYIYLTLRRKGVRKKEEVLMVLTMSSFCRKSFYTKLQKDVTYITSNNASLLDDLQQNKKSPFFVLQKGNG